MKKTGIAIVAILMLLLCCSVIVALMATGIIQKGDNNKYLIKSNEELPRYDVGTPLASGEVDITEEIEGFVIAPENSTVSFKLEDVSENFNLLVKVGEYVEEGEMLYIDNNGNNILAPHNLSVTKIDLNNGFLMEVYIYKDLVISLDIKAKYQRNIADIEFTTNYEGEIKELNLVEIYSDVNDDRVNVILNCPFDVYQNTKMDVLVKYDTLEGLTLISEEFVFVSEDGRPYIHVVEEGEYSNNGEVKDVYLDVYSYDEGKYIVRNILDGYFAVYSQEEKFFEKQ